MQDSIISEFWLQGANTQITLINNRITTFTRETGLNNKLTWINNIYSGEITKDNDNDIIVLPVNNISGYSIVVLTEEEYNALGTIDDNAIYIVKGLE